MARTLGVICARGGSKEFPEKNLATLYGLPLVCHSIKQARGSTLLSRWLVSTDNEKIRDKANRYHCRSAPFLRPPELAKDDSRIEGALQHALEYCEKEEGVRYDHICMLLNSHPLRTSEDIDGCIELTKVGPVAIAVYDSVVSGYWIHHPYELRPVGSRRVSLEKNRFYRNFYQRQDSPRLFLGNGAVVVMRRDCLVDKDSIWGERSYLYPMPMWRSQDVDSPADLEACKILLGGKSKWVASSVETIAGSS